MIAITIIKLLIIIINIMHWIIIIVVLIIFSALGGFLYWKIRRDEKLSQIKFKYNMCVSGGGEEVKCAEQTGYKIN